MRVIDVLQHVERHPQVALRGQERAVGARRVRCTRRPSVEVTPLGVAREAVLHAYLLQIAEMAVEARQLELQLAVARRHVGVENRVLRRQGHRRGRGLEVYAEQYLVVDNIRLVLRHEPYLDAVVVEDRLVGLTDGNHFLRGLVLVEEDGASVNGRAVHEDLQAFLVRILRDTEVVVEVPALVGVAHVGAVEHGVHALPGGNVGQGKALAGIAGAVADADTRFLHPYRTVA